MPFSLKKQFAANQNCICWVEFSGKVYVSLIESDFGKVYESTDGVTFTQIFSSSFTNQYPLLFVVSGKLFMSHYGQSVNSLEFYERVGTSWTLRVFSNSQTTCLDVKIRGGKAYILTAGPNGMSSRIFEYTGGGISTFVLKKQSGVSKYISCMDASNTGDIYYAEQDSGIVPGNARIYKLVAGVTTELINLGSGLTPVTIRVYNSLIHYVRKTTDTFTLASLDTFSAGATETIIGTFAAANASINAVPWGFNTEVFDSKLWLGYVFRFSGGDHSIKVHTYDGASLALFDEFDGTVTDTFRLCGFFTPLLSELIFGAPSKFVTTATVPDIVTGDYLYIPAMQSLTFVNAITPNNCETFQTLDNALFCKQKHYGFLSSNYFNKVAKCDIFPLQYQSNFEEDPLIELVNYKTGAQIATYTPTLVEENIGVNSIYDITIKNHGGGQSRVYFNVGSIPLPLVVGDEFDIINSADGFNGTYTITSIQSNISLGTQYLVINLLYNIVNVSSNAQGEFTQTAVEFNVYEFLVNNLGALPNGEYFIRVTATSDEATITVPTEPFLLQAEHEGTHLIEWRNFDNAWDMTWTTGIVCRRRVESTFFKRFPGSVSDNVRNTDESLHKLSGRMRRIMLMEFWQLPPYLHETLAVIFTCDLVKINGVEFQTEEELSEPKYITRYKLANSEIKVEQVGWFRNNNSDDTGSVGIDPGLLIVNEGFLKL